MQERFVKQFSAGQVEVSSVRFERGSLFEVAGGEDWDLHDFQMSTAIP